MFCRISSPELPVTREPACIRGQCRIGPNLSVAKKNVRVNISQGTAGAKLRVVAHRDATGPKPTLGLDDHAAAQLHRSGRSCVAQHFPTAKVR